MLVVVNICYDLIGVSIIWPLIQRFLISCLLNDLIFGKFSVSSSFGRSLNENVDERGRNIMRERTLASLLVRLNG